MFAERGRERGAQTLPLYVRIPIYIPFTQYPDLNATNYSLLLLGGKGGQGLDRLTFLRFRPIIRPMVQRYIPGQQDKVQVGQTLKGRLSLTKLAFGYPIYFASHLTSLSLDLVDAPCLIG